ncbi:MAG: hypothetical protein AAFY03_13860 [Pseudomonadota bacterium]
MRVATPIDGSGSPTSSIEWAWTPERYCYESDQQNRPGGVEVLPIQSKIKNENMTPAV